MATRKWHSGRVHRTGTEHCTITEAHPSHTPVGNVDHKGAGNDMAGFDPHCPLCREEHEEQEHADGDHPA
jgi:hypothetical protein